MRGERPSGCSAAGGDGVAVLGLLDTTRGSVAEAGGGAARHARAWSFGRPAVVAGCRRLGHRRTRANVLVVGRAAGAVPINAGPSLGRARVTGATQQRLTLTGEPQPSTPKPQVSRSRPIGLTPRGGPQARWGVSCQMGESVKTSLAQALLWHQAGDPIQHCRLSATAWPISPSTQPQRVQGRGSPADLDYSLSASSSAIASAIASHSIC